MKVSAISLIQREMSEGSFEKLKLAKEEEEEKNFVSFQRDTESSLSTVFIGTLS